MKNCNPKRKGCLFFKARNQIYETLAIFTELCSRPTHTPTHCGIWPFETGLEENGQQSWIRRGNILLFIEFRLKYLRVFLLLGSHVALWRPWLEQCGSLRRGPFQLGSQFFTVKRISSQLWGLLNNIKAIILYWNEIFWEDFHYRLSFLSFQWVSKGLEFQMLENKMFNPSTSFSLTIVIFTFIVNFSII